MIPEVGSIFHSKLHIFLESTRCRKAFSFFIISYRWSVIENYGTHPLHNTSIVPSLKLVTKIFREERLQRSTRTCNFIDVRGSCHPQCKIKSWQEKYALEPPLDFSLEGNDSKSAKNQKGDILILYRSCWVYFS